MSTDQSINIENITKHYNKTKALEQVGFSIRSGELCGLIGADGAGKTTLFEILATLLSPDEGNASVAGMDIRNNKKEIRSLIGYMPGKFSLYQDLSVEENLNFYATIFGTTIDQGYSLIAPIWDQLKPFSNRPAGKLSGGMKQKLALCCALVHQPEILLLDEPTTGVDPVSRREFWEMLSHLKEKGITILVSTPYMDEAVKCERIAFLHEGRLLEVKTPDEFVDSYRGFIYQIQSDVPYRILRQLGALSQTKSAYLFGRNVHWTIDEKETNQAEWLLRKEGIEFSVISQIKPTIEDALMQLMKGDTE